MAMWKLLSVLPVQFQLNERLTINRHAHPWQKDSPAALLRASYLLKSQLLVSAFGSPLPGPLKELVPGTQKACLGPSHFRDKTLN